MFILNFIVLFNVKKGSIVAYKSSWVSILSDQVYMILYRVKKGAAFITNDLKLYNYRYHFTTVTSRSTSYLLFLF
jgi:hypothetical protein